MNILLNKTQGPRKATFYFLSAWPYILAILIVGMAGAHFVNVASTAPFHYLAAFCLAMLGAGGLIVFRQHLSRIALFGLVIASGLPMFYRVWTQNDPLWDWKGHLGGTLPEPMIHLVDAPLLLILIMAFFPVIFRRKPLPAWTGLDTCILLFLAACLASFANAQDHLYAFFELFRYVKYTLLYLALRILLTKESYSGLILAALLCIVCIQAIVSITTNFLGVGWMLYGASAPTTASIATDTGAILRVGGLLGGANMLGTWLLLPLSVFTSYLFTNSKVKNKIIVFSVSIIALITFIFTFCRSAWGGFIVGFLFLIFISAIRKRLKREHVVVMLVLSLIGLLAASVSGTASNITARIFADETGAWGVRPELNAVAMKMIEKHLFTGIGLNNFQVASHGFDPNGITAVFDHPAHNVFMLFAGETGIIGLFCFISMGLYLFCRSILLTRNPTDDYRFCVGASCAMFLVALCINELGDYTLRLEMMLSQCAIISALVMSVKPLYIGPKTISPNSGPLRN